MPRARKDAIPPSNTSHLFGGRKPNERGASVTSERIASDLAAFRKSGGHIEVLGVTRVLKTIEGGEPAAAAAPAPAADASKGKRKSS